MAKLRLGHAALVGGLLAYTTLTQAQIDSFDMSWVDIDRVMAGEVLHRTGKQGPLIVTIDVAIRIDAPAESIWSVLTACNTAPEYVPHVVDCELIETVDDGTAQLFNQTVKPAFFLPRFEHVFRLDYQPYQRIDVHRVSGPIAHMEGSWWLREQGDGIVLLLHSLQLNPGIPIPRFLVRATLRRDVPRLLAAIRERAEALR